MQSLRLWLIAPLVVAAAQASAAELPPVTVKLPSGTVLAGELAANESDRARGLMFRIEQQFGPEQAMVFLFEELGDLSFWMKNMNFAIDMVWLSPDMKVVSIEHDVPPCEKEPCRFYTPMQKAQLVIELYRGTAKKEHLKNGDRVEVLQSDGTPLAVPGMAR